MPDRLAPQASLLAAVLVLLTRGLSATPADLTVAGAVGLVVYGLLTLGRPVFARLTDVPSQDD